MRRIIVGIAVVLCAVAVVFAQSDGNRQIEGCSPDDAKDALASLYRADYATDFAAFVTDSVSTDSDADFNELWDRVIVLRNRYYADIQPHMPNCALSARIQLLLERLLADYQYTTSVLELMPLDDTYRSTFTNLKEVNERIAVSLVKLSEYTLLLDEVSKRAKE
jgi:hypothetical protein